MKNKFNDRMIKLKKIIELDYHLNMVICQCLPDKLFTEAVTNKARYFTQRDLTPTSNEKLGSEKVNPFSTLN